MISILKNKVLFGFCIVCVFTAPTISFAQRELTQTLSVSPTLFQMSANPSQSWTSSIRVVNVNDYPIVVYPQVVNFAPSGESGTGSLIPIFAEETLGQSLAEWVTLSQTEVEIAPQQTAVIPFSVTVAQNAAPGGHYAAILIGTKPPGTDNSPAQVQTAQFVTSLLFVRVSGEVIEIGNIREFTTEKIFNNDPEIQFDVRFENTGNVHLQPQGDIIITNMWGSKRGEIPVNYQTHFGNVLPDSIRKFSFTWTGEKSSYDIGRFKAIATLGYGEDTKKFTTSVTYFWVIPLKQIAIILAVLLLLFWFLAFAIKLYIRHMLALAGLQPVPRGTMPKKYSEYSIHEQLPAKTVIIRKYETVTGPVRHSLFELIQNLKSAKAVWEFLGIIGQFLIRNLISVLFVFVVLSVLFVSIWFFSETNTKSRPYEVSIINPDSTVTISSDEILYQSLPNYELLANESKVGRTDFSIELINASGEPGLAAKAKRKLEAYGYTLTKISTELGRFDAKTVIIYNPVNKDAALDLSKKLNEAIISVDSGIQNDVIRIYVGTDNR